MDEIESSEQKPKLCRLAILSVLLAIFGFISSVKISVYRHDTPNPPLIPFLFFFAGIVVGIIAYCIIRKDRKKLRGGFTAILGIILSVYCIANVVPCMTKHNRQITDCSANIYSLSGSMMRFRFSGENENRYPTPNIWCDLLKNKGMPEHLFICPSSKAEKCSYAINPNCEPNSPKDMVLLFETKDGWNQFGGPELLTTENHEGKGCNILFNEGNVKFIKTGEIGKLKWKAE